MTVSLRRALPGMPAAFVLAVLAVLAVAPAWALDADDVKLPDAMTVAGQDLVLNGTALRVAYGIADVYVAGLYLPAKTVSDADALGMDGAKYMSMTFVRDVDKEDICDAWAEGMEDNLSKEESAAMAARLDQLCKATPDIEDGGVMAYAYDPAADATTFTYNNAPLATIAGRDFFRAMLSCWIGPDPGPGKKFKKGVLGLK